MTDSTTKKMPIRKAMLFAFIMTFLIMAFSIGMEIIGNYEGWAGFLFFWFWTTIREFKFDQVVRDARNAIVGIAASYVMYFLLQTYGHQVFDPVITLTIFLILFFVKTKMIPQVVGETSFLYFTILTSHAYLAKTDYLQVVSAFILGVIFFLILLGATVKLLERKKESSSASA